MQDWVSLTALVVSIVSLIASAGLAARQVGLMRRANQLPLVVNLTQELRSTSFLERERYVLTKLSENDPENGQVRLPERAGDAVQVVASLFNSIGILVAFKVIDQRIAISIFGPRAERAWRCLQPFIKGERE